MEKDFKLCINILVVDRSFQPRELLTERLKLKKTHCSIHACFYEYGYQQIFNTEGNYSCEIDVLKYCQVLSFENYYS